MRTRAPRGFTLSELLVGLVVTSIVMAATTAVFLGVQRSYQAETEAKLITENGRGALLFFERTLPLAGYGLDPRIAIDVTGTVARDNQNVTTVSYTPNQPAMVGPNGGIVSDELAFRYRDTSFLRTGRLNSGNTQLTIDQPFGVQVPSGKLMMVLCRGGSDYAVVRTQAAAAATASTVTVANAAAPFVANSASCLADSGATSPWVFMVHEHRVRIVNLNGRPWLVSFRNLDASVTDLSLDNFDPIAPDVESFHVAFAMNRARPGLACCQTAPDTGGNTNWIVGDASGETFFAQPANVLRTTPEYRTGYEASDRFTRHPANIRAVHVALVMRSSRASPTGRRTAASTSIFNGNVPAAPEDGFLRSLMHTAVRTPNLLSRSSFVPQLRTASDTRDLNTWGG
jgi:type IV pilus assembly protein PilW